MSTALKNLARNDKRNTVATPQRVRTPGRTDEVKNYAGGYVFSVSDKDRLERFLILGTDGGTYYASEQKLTGDNVKFVKDYIAKDYRGVVDALKDVAVKNRAPKNSPSLYTLALLANAKDGDKVYLRASGVFGDVVRTSTHLFEFANYVDSLGGWGRAKRNLISDWYTGQDAGKLAYQAVKYRQREGWTHRDLFRKVHPTGIDQRVGNFILGKESFAGTPGVDTTILDGFTEMQAAKTVNDVIAALVGYKGLPWETIPTQFLNDRKVWETLFYNGALGQTALLRNVVRLSKIGMLDDPMTAGKVAEALADAERIVKGRVHPVQYANALGIYRNGPISRATYGYGSHGARGVKDYAVNAKIAGALEAGFYASFGSVTPANKATMVSVDVSGSMTWGAPAGLVGMNYMEAAAVMAMVTLRTEPYSVLNAFSTGMQEVNVSDSDSLDTVINKFKQVRMGGTDCAQPMVHAKAKGLNIDTFFVYTDNETWAGGVKPAQALKQYRASSGRAARLAVVALAASPFTIADPSDRGMMDFVGMDAAAPRVMADFSAGRI